MAKLTLVFKCRSKVKVKVIMLKYLIRIQRSCDNAQANLYALISRIQEIQEYLQCKKP